MRNFVENNLIEDENILKSAEQNKAELVFWWIFGVVLCWLIFPPIYAIFKTLAFSNTELTITDKRVLGKSGVLSRHSLDAPLNKIQNVAISSGILGKIFNYGNIKIQTGGDALVFLCIKKPDEFKRFLMNQMEVYENERIKTQAMEMATAMKNI